MSYEFLAQAVKAHVRPDQYQHVVEHGLGSCIVQRLVYMAETIPFYDAHEDAIWDVVKEVSETGFTVDLLQFVNNIHQKEIGGNVECLDDMKHALTWWIVKTLVRRFIYAAEVDNVGQA